jgi:uncharacterized protein YjiS (DUF1127 family)
MAYNVKTHPAFAGYNLPETEAALSGARRAFAKLAIWSAENRAYYNTVAELYALSDRDLADIGISRSDIPAVARQATRSTGHAR